MLKNKKSNNYMKFNSPIIIFEHWAFTILLIIISITGLFLLRDWLFATFGVYGEVFVPTPAITLQLHKTFGAALVVLGLLHLAIHITSTKKDILPVKTLQDFKAFLHSGMYLIGLSRREDRRISERYNGRQRIVYIALVYILGLAIITGLLHYVHIFSEELLLVHIIPGGLAFMVLLFQFLITIRKHDFTALKCTFFTGKLPIWYVRKNFPVLYKGLESKKTEISDNNLFLYWWKFS
jgi:hypothetical protein